MTALSPDALYRPCRFDGLTFDTSDQLEALSEVVGQARARRAVTFGVTMPHRGYNLFVLGPAGVGKRHLVRTLLEDQARSRKAPSDWCYVNNFRAPHRPQALELPAGWAVILREDMAQLVEELHAAIPAMFDSEEHRAQAERIETEIRERQEAGLNEVGQEAARENISLIHTPAGFTLAPSRDGELLSPEDVMKMPEQDRVKLESTMELLQQKLQKVIRHAQQLQKEKRQRFKQLIQEMTVVTLTSALEDLRQKYAHLPGVIAYLDEVHLDVLNHIEDFRPPAEGETMMSGMGMEARDTLRRFEVNVVVGNDQHDGLGAPLVFEDNPTYPNLLGRIEHVARFGTLVTDFGLIKAGALHRANGGYLVLDAYQVLSQPFAWEGLKRTLASGEIRPEALGQTFGLVSTVGLEPEPIPADVKVVLLGDRHLYYLLLAHDREFGELFKVAADFEDEIDRVPANEHLYARLVAGLLRQHGLLPLQRRAMARVIEQSARWAGDAARLSANLEALTDLLREADSLARQGNGGRIELADVELAITHDLARADRVQRRVHDAIAREEIFVATQGTAIGQVNGLSVSFAGRHAFAFPTRITATTRLGEGEVVDIQREVELGGPIHSKGVLILSALLGARFAHDFPLSLRASLVFEQTYGPVDGDSASVAEFCVLLSALGRFGLRQALAVTGSLDQLGRVQPIGGVNEKIEGFFDVCNQRGLDGEQGVIIPAANTAHLMLRADVIAAVAAGRFQVYAVSHVDEALALLSGMSAGERREDGTYAQDSANGRAEARLKTWSDLRQRFSGKTESATSPEDPPS